MYHSVHLDGDILTDWSACKVLWVLLSIVTKYLNMLLNHLRHSLQWFRLPKENDLSIFVLENTSRILELENSKYIILCFIIKNDQKNTIAMKNVIKTLTKTFHFRLVSDLFVLVLIGKCTFVNCILAMTSNDK